MFGLIVIELVVAPVLHKYDLKPAGADKLVVVPTHNVLGPVIFTLVLGQPHSASTNTEPPIVPESPLLFGEVTVMVTLVALPGTLVNTSGVIFKERPKFQLLMVYELVTPPAVAVTVIILPSFDISVIGTVKVIFLGPGAAGIGSVTVLEP